MRRKKAVSREFLEGRYAFQNKVAIFDNPYKGYIGGAEEWESGWRYEEEEVKGHKIIGCVFGLLLIIGVISLVIPYIKGFGIGLFGEWFEASEGVVNDTVKAQQELNTALYQVFNESGRLEIRENCTVRAYISKENYMQVPYPDRNGAIRAVGKAWCTNTESERCHGPMVELRDIQTNDELGSYACLTGWVYKK